MKKMLLKATIVFSILVFIILATPYFLLLQTEVTFEDIVTEKWIKAAADGTQKYLIATMNHGVLENTDSAYFWKFNSSDFWAQIQLGQRYRFTVVGWRIPLLSWYPNIIRLEPL